MANESTRREVMRGGLAFAGLAALGIPDWAIPVLAQDEILVPFTDIPGGKVNTNPAPDRRSLDTQTITTLLTPRDQHFDHPALRPPDDRRRRVPPAYRGLVDKPQTLIVDDLARCEHRGRLRVRVLGQSRPLQGLTELRPLDRRARCAGPRPGWHQGDRARVRLLRCGPGVWKKSRSAPRSSKGSISSSAAACPPGHRALEASRSSPTP